MVLLCPNVTIMLRGPILTVGTERFPLSGEVLHPIAQYRPALKRIAIHSRALQHTVLYCFKDLLKPRIGRGDQATKNDGPTKHLPKHILQAEVLQGASIGSDSALQRAMRP